MLNRWIGILTLALMLLANAALVFRDFVPAWLAGDPPENDYYLLGRGEKRCAQLGIYDAADRRVGQSWTVSHILGNILTVESWHLLEPMSLPNGVRTPMIRVQIQLRYQERAVVDDLKLIVHGLPVPVSLSGEFVPPGDFAVQWSVGDHRGSVVLNAQATRALGDVIRPFDHLPGLYVGRTWRLKLFDPLAQLVPGWAGRDLTEDAMLVRVTAQESLHHRGETLDVFRIESQRATAWATTDGRIVRQEVDVPLIGRLTLRDEPFDERELRAVRGLDLAGD